MKARKEINQTCRDDTRARARAHARTHTRTRVSHIREISTNEGSSDKSLIRTFARDGMYFDISLLTTVWTHAGMPSYVTCCGVTNF